MLTWLLKAVVHAVLILSLMARSLAAASIISSSLITLSIICDKIPSHTRMEFEQGAPINGLKFRASCSTSSSSSCALIEERSLKMNGSMF